MLFGNPDAQKDFAKRNKAFVDRVSALHETSKKVLLKPVTGSGLADGIIFFLNRLIAEEFFEILLMASNGYGKAAKRLLRGMFERTVATAYIEKDPASAERFINFGEIQRLKYANHKKTLFGVDIFPPEELEELKKTVERIKPDFLEVLCEEHKRTRLSPSWIKLDTLAMAREVGLEKFYIDCYFEPTQQVHNTTLAISSRLKEGGEDSISFNDELQPEDADRAIQLAHFLFTQILHHHNDHFKLGFDEEVKQRLADVDASWPKK